jgi:RNA polymerase sigma-70 factor (ECF subfamily)
VVEEINLLKRAQALDEEALAEIHDTYYQAVYRYFSFRMPDPQTAEDLTSEVFLRFLKAIRDQSAPPNTIQGWLFGAAKNVAREYYRRSNKMEVVAITDQIPAGESSLEHKISKRLDVEAMMKGMEVLTDDQKHVLALRFGYELPIREVAAIVDKSEAAVKMLQARAIMTLTKQMELQS